MSSTRALLLAAIVGAVIAQPIANPALHAQQPAQATINQVPLSVGRALPISSTQPITRVSVVNPEIADVALLSDRELVINAHSIGETDIIFWPEGGAPVQYRVQVTDRPDRSQVLLNVKVAEVRRDLLREIGFSGVFRDNNTRVGTGSFNTDNVFDEFGNIVLPPETGFGTFLSDFGTTDFLALIEAEATRGNARILAQPNLLAANRDSANFLVGGEFPVPVVQGGGSEDGGIRVTIQFREFGVRLGFAPHILNDSLIKLRVRPEVSSLDYANAVILSGFRIPALRTRRVESTVDVRAGQSVVLSGLFNDEREQVKTGIPFLQDIPILGLLFSSSRWQSNETELVVIVTPQIIDPLAMPAHRAPATVPDTAMPARDVLEPVLRPAPTARPGTPPSQQR
jgi:Flp pilus assembly secretin CpaC